jgi:hypothetical protein
MDRFELDLLNVPMAASIRMSEAPRMPSPKVIDFTRQILEP